MPHEERSDVSSGGEDIVGGQQRPRAVRYSITSPVRYREADGRPWREGLLVNASRTGVLFEAGGPVPAVLSPIEFVLALPTLGDLPVGKGACVRCEGHVVRCREGPDLRPAVAATIDTYEFVPRGTDAAIGSA